VLVSAAMCAYGARSVLMLLHNTSSTVK
jgi:hypothetical protein